MDKVRRHRYEITGAVQGVGFRPFVYRLAHELGLTGEVWNTSEGVIVEVEGQKDSLGLFARRLETEKPSTSSFTTVMMIEVGLRGDTNFVISKSNSKATKSATLLPDLAPCAACLNELLDPEAHRFLYPFTNCTYCGPRYSIITGIPYDRPNTTMAGFPLCDHCAREYLDPADRRFHAQPIACPRCGPALDTAIGEAVDALERGEIVALKGVGGFQLLVDARSSGAVLRLRQRKHREEKPFAVMFKDLDIASRSCVISPDEARLLESSAAPIVLVRARPGAEIAPEVGQASPWIGAMLPSSPLHHLLLRACRFPVVATSGNRSDEPICIDNAEAAERLAGIADLQVTHDRPIARALDDSVTRVQRGAPVILRRARGYAPLPIVVQRELPRVLAVGAHQKNTVAIAIGRRVFVSQHLGDLDTPESRQAFTQAIDDLCRLYDFQPEMVVCDLHPDYFSTWHAESLGLPLLRVQHHLAHAASCAAENGVSGKHLAVTWDGTGLGLDGVIWGGEFFLDGQRIAHLHPFPLPGGEAAARDCRRVAASLLAGAGLDPARSGHPQAAQLTRLTAPVTTSAGRLFDGIAALAGVADRNAYEGQAPMRLEYAIGAGPHQPYAGEPLDWRPLIEQLLADQDPQRIAGRFHETLAQWIVAIARRAAVADVVLSGGVFQNAWLTQRAADLLEAAGFRCHTHRQVPPNDGGLSLGQAVLAGA